MKILTKYEELLRRAERIKRKKALRKKKKIQEVISALDPPTTRSPVVRFIGANFRVHLLQNVKKETDIDK